MIVLDQDGKLMHAAFSLDDKGKVRLYNNYEDFTILYIGLINNDSENNDFKKGPKAKNKESFKVDKISSDLKYFYFEIKTKPEPGPEFEYSRIEINF